MKPIIQFLIGITFSFSAIAAQEEFVGAAFCVRSTTAPAACHVGWKWVGAPRTYQTVQRFEPTASRWWIVEEGPGASVGKSTSVVPPGYLYRVRACNDPIMDSTCSESKVFWAPLQPASGDDIPEIVVTNNGRILGVSKNLPYAPQLEQYNLYALAAAMENVDPSQLPPMTAPERRWGAKGFNDWDNLENNIYEDYAGYRQQRPPHVVDPSQPREFISDVPPAERAQFRAGRIHAWEDSMIVFAPTTGIKHTITVFADVTCKHCQQIMRDMDELNRLGVRVRFMAFPINGLNTDDARKAADVWCAANPKAALKSALSKEPIAPSRCAKPIVPYHFALARQLGFIGSPTIVSESGEVIGGYLPPNEMLARLDQLKKTTARLQ